MLNDKVILITGGTGSFGHRFSRRILDEYSPRKVIIYSRDEYKQYLMKKEFADHDSKIRFFIGDVRDRNRLYRAFEGVDIVIHAAALKHVPLIEYNPIEAVKTNIHGAENIIDAAIDSKTTRTVVALSTDKAVNPINLYGATKLVSDKLFVTANAYVGDKKTTFSVVRYGNVAGSRGSVIPYFKTLLSNGEKILPITDVRMTRFWITLDEGVDLVFKAIQEANGGEVFVPKISSFKVVDLAKAMGKNADVRIIGAREGEKLHEVMITEEDSNTTFEYNDDYYIIYPNFDWWCTKEHFKEGGKLVKNGFRYASDTNEKWLSVEQLREACNKLDYS